MARFSLNLRHQQQQMKNDCWATCLAMVSEWRGFAITRQEILTRATGILQSYAYGDMADCPESNKVIKTMTNSGIEFELLGARKLEAGEFVQYLNRRRVVMLSMLNHMWLVTGHSDLGLLVHDVGKKEGPHPATPAKVKSLMVDTMVLI